jgi:protein SSD1
MLLANIAVAHKIAESFPEEALLRNHPPPGTKQLTELAESLQVYGVVLDISGSKALNDSFENIKNPLHRDLIRLLAIKSMKRAQYYCTGSKEMSEYFHYALGIPLYTHFTYIFLLLQIAYPSIL